MSFVNVLSKIKHAFVDETRDNHTIAVEQTLNINLDENLVEILDHKVDITAGGVAVQGHGCCHGTTISIDDLRYVVETYDRCVNPEVE